MATRWVALKGPQRRNGGLRCGVDVVAGCSVAGGERPSALAIVFGCLWRLAFAPAWLPHAKPSCRRGAQATLRIHRQDFDQTFAMQCFATIVLLAIYAGAAEPREDLKPLGASILCSDALRGMMLACMHALPMLGFSPASSTAPPHPGW